MKKGNDINTICFNASFWPACTIVILSIALSVLLFKHHANSIIEREYSRHELINQLLSKAAAADIIIENHQALYVTLKDFKKKYHLDELSISNNKESLNDVDFLSFLRTQRVVSSWTIPGLAPTKYILIQSKIDKKTILMPFLTSLGIIILFIFASIIMYRRIKQKLHSQIVVPLNQTLNCNGNDFEWFDKKSAASEIVDLYNKTNDFIRTLHQQRDTIQEQNVKQAKYDVALQVAHDIRSPVLALETITGLFPELEGEGKVMINNATKRISQIANDILTEHLPISKETNVKPCSELRLPISDLVRALFEEKKASCPNKAISFELIIDDLSHDTFVNISEEHLNRVLSNIIDNAIQAINGGGIIQMSLRSDIDNAYLCIQDSGCGIPRNEISNIFERGFSLNKEAGNGLGLSYAKEIIEMAKGNIEVVSSVGKGTTIKITLPIAHPT